MATLGFVDSSWSSCCLFVDNLVLLFGSFMRCHVYHDGKGMG